MAEASTELPLILLPGIGTDARLFALQRMEFRQVLVPDWLPPRRRESLSDYAARMAEGLSQTGPCLVGGMSFGGMVALEMTRHLPASGCVLIASVKSSRELPLLLRSLAPIAYLLPSGCDRVVAGCGSLMKHSIGRVLPRRGRMLCDHLSKTRTPLIPWAWQAGLGWRPKGDWPCPVFQLHGAADPIFPVWRTRADQIIPGGGHLLPITHPFAVNDFLRDCMTRVLRKLPG